FRARYVTEPVWTGTHPEYPLYVPFLHSYAFQLMGSFRDDIAKVWQAVAVLAWLQITFWSTTSTTRGKLWGAAAVVVFLALTLGQAEDAKVEIHAAIFTSLIFFAVLEADRGRLPLYVAGLATVKNEGLA